MWDQAKPHLRNVLEVATFKFCVIEVAIFSKDHDLIFLRAQGDSQMVWFAAEAVDRLLIIKDGCLP